MPKKTSSSKSRARKQSALINSIVHQNILQIRQNLIDEYWIGRALLRDQEVGIKRKPRSKWNSDDKKAFNYLLSELVREELGDTSYVPGGRLPESPAFRHQYEQVIGIDYERLRLIDENKVLITVEEMMAFAYVGNVDVAHMLTPPIETLNLEKEFHLEFPFRPDTSIVDWMLWISNFRQLPEKSAHDYLSNTAVAIKGRKKVDAKKKRSKGEPENELHARVMSGFSASTALFTKDPDLNKFKDRDRFEFPTAPELSFPRKRSEKTAAIKCILFIRTRIRILVQLTQAKHKSAKLSALFKFRLDLLSRDVRELLNMFRDI